MTIFSNISRRLGSRIQKGRRVRKSTRLDRGVEELERRACPAAVSVSGPAVVDEAAGTARVVVSLSKPVTKPVTVAYSIRSAAASATFGQDYRLSSDGRMLPPDGQLTFRPRQTSQVINVQIMNDAVREGDENFTLALRLPRDRSLTAGRMTHKLTIRDDDNYTLSTSGPAVVAAGQIRDYFLRLSSPATRRETFYVSTREGTASVTKDYRPLNRVPVTILPGQSSQRIQVATVPNPGAQYDRTFLIDIESGTHGFPSPRPLEVTIPGPRGPRPPEISITNSVFVREGDAGRTEVVLTATLSRSSSRPISVRYMTRDGSATIADSDYVAAAGVLSFAPGELSRTLTVEVIGDTTPEESESFFVDLLDPADALLGSSTANVTIINDDARPPESDYDDEYGYGIVDAAASLAHYLGLTAPFPAVPELGGVQWGNDLVKAPAVWAQGYTGRGIVVAVIDTGVDFTHRDLYLNIWINQGEIPAALRTQLTDVDGDGIITFRDLNAPANTAFVRDVNGTGYIDGGDLIGDTRWVSGQDADGNGYQSDLIGWNFVGRNARPSDYDTHGTHVAGTIGAMQNRLGHTGVAFDAQIMPIATLGSQGGSAADVAAGIRYAANNGAHVINLSLGGPFSLAMEDAINYATGRGVVVVAAAGNDGEPTPGFPANLATSPGVISVGAVDRTGTIADFSHGAGPNPAMKHVMAPGVDVFSTIPGGGYDSYPGTSMAAPHVAGVVALMLSARGTFDTVGRDALVDAIIDTSRGPTGTPGSAAREGMVGAVRSLPKWAIPRVAGTAGGNGLPSWWVAVAAGIDGQDATAKPRARMFQSLATRTA